MDFRNIVARGLDTVLFGIGFVAIAPLPRTCLVALSRLLGAGAYWLARRERRIALANIDLVYGDRLERARKADLARSAFQTFSLLTLDLLWFGLHTESRLRRWVRFDASFEAQATAPCVFATLHLGNWEAMGQAAALRGWAAASVAMPLKNGAADRRLNRWRARTGQRIVPRRGAVRQLLKALRANERVALLMDQNTKPEEGGVFVDFFGMPASVSRAAAALAIRAQAPIVPVYCLREKDGGYRVQALPALHPPAHLQGESELTRAMCRALESIVLAHPEQWLWMYKRWKYIPPRSAGRAWPFYARRPGPSSGTRTTEKENA